MTDRKRPGPTPIGEAIASFVAQAKLAPGMDRARALLDWDELVGPQIAAVTEPESVSPDGVLRVRVATAPWAQELGMMTPRILGRLNAGRTGRFTGIRWIVGPVRRRPGA